MLIIVAAGVVIGVAALYYVARRKAERQLAATFPQPAERIVARGGGVVIAYHPEVREVGEAVLRAGGNAFDAFVAAAAAENVMAEGASSLAGPLGVLVYRAEDGLTEYLDADYNDPLDPRGRATFNEPLIGKRMLVPGAPAGLEALAARYGRLPLAELLQPAVALAEEGFTVNNIMAVSIAGRAGVLKKTQYGRETFFRDGRPLVAGETIRQPEAADFLRRLGAEGSAYVYRGDWAERFLYAVETHGGRLTAADLSGYRVKWCAPWTTTYRGHTLHASSGTSYGGLWVLLALKTLEHFPLPQTPPYWADADHLELLIRIHRQVWSEPDIFNARVLNDPEAVETLLTAEHAASIRDRVLAKDPLNFMGFAGSHSYHLIVRDDAGNVASGTTTIESDPWADGVFVQGVPLPSSGRIPWHTKPGQRRLSPFSMLLALQDGRPRFSVGAIGNSIVEASFQFLVKLIDYGMDARDTVSTPRFGTFPERASPKLIPRPMPIKIDRNWLDPRVDDAVVRKLKASGLKVEKRGLVETGSGAVLRVGPGAEVEGATAPLPYIRNPFG